METATNSPIKIQYYNKTAELGRILGKKGTIELIIFIHKRPRRYTELEEETNISHTSLLRRLKILQSLEIIKKRPIRSMNRETNEYEISPIGGQLMSFIERYEKRMKIPLEQRKIIEIEK